MVKWLYPRVKKYLESHPDADHTEIMRIFGCGEKWAYHLLKRYREENKFIDHPERCLLDAFREGHSEGLVEGLVLGGLTVELLKHEGYAPSDILAMIKQHAQQKYEMATGG